MNPETHPPDPRPLSEPQQIPNDDDLGEEPRGPDAPENDPPLMPPAPDDDPLPPPGTPVLHDSLTSTSRGSL